MLIVSGWVYLPPEVVPMPSAKLHVRVEDVNHADGLARVVAEQVISGIKPENIESGTVQFSISVADADTLESNLALRVHLDINSDGTVDVGDYVSTVLILVSERKDTSSIKVPIQLVQRQAS